MAPPRTLNAVAACMKNEGQFLLEWVAHYRGIGFDRVFVITNDCTDGTDEIADRLDAAGEAIHLRNHIEPGEAPQVTGMRLLLADPRLAEVAWLLHCDSDEFLNITAGDGKVQDLLQAVGEDCDAIAITWRLFGSDGVKDYEPCLVTERYVTRAKRAKFFHQWQKTMFRPEKFGWARDHMPKDPVAPGIRLRNTAGKDMATQRMLKPRHSRYLGNDEAWTWDNAALHHYATRAEDIFLMKNVRGDGMGSINDKYFLNARAWRSWNTSGYRDTSMHRHVPATKARLAALLADPVLAELDQKAKDWFQRMKTVHLTPENRARWTKTTQAEDDPDGPDDPRALQD